MEIKKLYIKAAIGITKTEALALINADIDELFFYSNKLREDYFGDGVKLCSIINAKSGSCSQDCRYCAQSAKYKTGAVNYPLVGRSKMAEASKRAESSKVSCFSIVTSGRKIGTEELEKITALAPKNKRFKVSASLGELTLEDMKKLAKAGIKKYHHNIETARRHFPKICSTHTFDDRIRTIKNAKKAGMKVCSGGIFGLGEKIEDRVDMAMTLRELAVDSIPINILTPIKHTPLENQKKLNPIEILRSIAIFRFILPKKDIMICGGREHNLGDLQSWIFRAGANGLMVGGYLTSPSRPVAVDHKMISDLGLHISGSGWAVKPA